MATRAEGSLQLGVCLGENNIFPHIDLREARSSGLFIEIKEIEVYWNSVLVGAGNAKIC